MFIFKTKKINKDMYNKIVHLDALHKHDWIQNGVRTKNVENLKLGDQKVGFQNREFKTSSFFNIEGPKVHLSLEYWPHNGHLENHFFMRRKTI